MASFADYAGFLEAMAGHGFAVEAQRCVSVRNRKVGCGKCTEACISGCIRIDGRDIVVESERCVGCGTCATACPTGAIALTEPGDEELLAEMRQVMAHNGGPVVMTCASLLERAESMLDPDSVVKVACLGRIDESLLMLMVSEGATRLTLVHGECEACPYAKATSVIDDVTACAQSLVGACGSDCVVKPTGRFPKFCARGNGEGYDVRRREFLLGMKGMAKGGAQEAARFALNETLGITDEGVNLHVTDDGTLPHEVPPRRRRLLSALSVLGQSSEKTVDGRVIGSVEVDSDLCTGCGMCAVFCPTGALIKHREVDEAAMKACAGLYRAPGNPRGGKRDDAPKTLYKRHKASPSSSFATGEAVELRFATGLCTACGTCRQVCPAHAIRLRHDVPAAQLLEGYGRSMPLKDIFREKGGPDAIRNSMGKLIDSPYLWG